MCIDTAVVVGLHLPGGQVHDLRGGRRRVVDEAAVCRSELDDGRRAARVTVLEGLLRIKEIRLIDGQSVRAEIGGQKVPRGVVRTVTARIARHAVGHEPGIEHHVVLDRARDDEDLLRDHARALEKDAAVIRSQRVDLQIHAGLGSLGGHRPVAHVEREAGLHGQRRTAREVLAARLPRNGKPLGGTVEIIVDQRNDLLLGSAAQGLGLADGQVLVQIGNVAVEEDQIGVFAGAGEIGLGLALLDEVRIDAVLLGTVDVLQQRVGPRDELVALLPQRIDLPLRTAHRGIEDRSAAARVTVLLTVGRVVGPLLGAFERRVPVTNEVEFIDGQLQLLLARIPRSAVALRFRHDIHRHAARGHQTQPGENTGI